MKKNLLDHLELLKQSGDQRHVPPFVALVRFEMTRAGVPQDRVDYILTRWLDGKYPAALESFSQATDVRVAWGIVGAQSNETFLFGIKSLWKGLQDRLQSLGVPTKPWSQTVKQSATDEVDKADCNFDPDCHAKVDWDKVGALKEETFERLKVLKEKEDFSGVKEVSSDLHKRLALLGMPENFIDYIVTKWVTYVSPAAMGIGGENQTAAVIV